jgi:hypothetical protein
MKLCCKVWSFPQGRRCYIVLYDLGHNIIGLYFTTNKHRNINF